MVLSEELVECGYQARFYEYMSEKGYNGREFSDFYLRSKFCHDEIDNYVSSYHHMPPHVFEKELIAEGFSGVPGNDFDSLVDDEVAHPKEAHWIGFTYRQLVYETGLLSRELADAVPFSYLLVAYPSLHTMGYGATADELCSVFSLPRRTEAQLEDYVSGIDRYMDELRLNRMKRFSAKPPVMNYTMPDGSVRQGIMDYCVAL